MPRVDVWDIQCNRDFEPIWIGYKQGLTEKYDLGSKLGEGGFGSVRVAVSKSNGAQFACKSICKRLQVPNLPPIKQQQHLENIKREVLILRKLRGTLNVVHLSGVYEDETHVHIVMELCKGGELFHGMGARHYSECTVAGYMRAVLRTLAQCHAHGILHRDIKPGNFMLLTESEDSPLKAIDFGLAVFFDPGKPPRTDLGLEGTPWYMAPEVLSSSVGPASDVWAAGVMAYQLLSGRFPFDDWAHPEAPALSLVWRSILSEAPPFNHSSWSDISEQGTDFCQALLSKDPDRRPTAREALAHPWLQKGNTSQRMKGAQLTQVVQRLQRHSQQNVFKKTVLDMMANELLARHMAHAQQDEQLACSNAEQQHVHRSSLPALQTPDRCPSRCVAASSALWSPCASTAGVSQHAALLAAIDGPEVTPRSAEGSVHRQQQLLHIVPTQRLNSPGQLNAPGAAAALEERAYSDNSDRSLPGLAGARPGDDAAALAPLMQAVLAKSPQHISRQAAACARLEGTWHGPIAARLAQPMGSGASAADVDFATRRSASVRGASSALEALARARERTAAATAVTTSAGKRSNGVLRAELSHAVGTSAGDAGGLAVVRNNASLPKWPHELHAPSPDPTASYRGPVRDVCTASMWDLQFMASRLAMEGSAHGNSYTQRLLQAASTHVGRELPATALHQAADLLAVQQQLSAGAGSDTSRLLQHAGPLSDQEELQEQRSHQQRQQRDKLAAAASRLEATWHGPLCSRAIKLPAAVDEAASGQKSAHGRDAGPERDLSWHGRTSHMVQVSMHAALMGAKRAREHEEFLRFLEAAKRLRHEQRKVARLVLEGSTHGGAQLFLPARGTCSVRVTGSSSSQSGSSHLGKPAHSLKDFAMPAASGTTQQATGSNPSAPCSDTGSCTDLNMLAGDNWKPGVCEGAVPHMPGPTVDYALPASTAGHSMFQAIGKERPTAANGNKQSQAGASALAREQVGGEPHNGELKVQLAEQILQQQSPGWQASLETRRRGQGAYAALMAATTAASHLGAASPQGPAVPPGLPNSAQPLPATCTQPAASPSQPQQQQQPEPVSELLRARQVSGVAPLFSPAISSSSSAAAAAAAAAAGIQLQPKTRAKHTGGSVTTANLQHTMLTPLQEALQLEVQQHGCASDAEPLLQHSSVQQRQQGCSQHSCLPAPGQAQHWPPGRQQGGQHWRPPPNDAMLPVPQSRQPRKQRQHNGDCQMLMPGGAGNAAKPTKLSSAFAPDVEGVGVMLQTDGVSALSPCGSKAAGARQAASSAPIDSCPDVLHVPPAAKEPPVRLVQPGAPPLSWSAFEAISAADVCGAPEQGARHGTVLPHLAQVQQLLSVLADCSTDIITVEQLQQGLASLGYLLEPSEVVEMAQNLGYGVGNPQGVAVSQFAASQLDWADIQVNHCKEWLQCLRATFDAMDVDKDGRLQPSEILAALKDKLAEAEVNAAIEDVLLEAAADEDEGIDFAAFKLLASTAPGLTPLDQYDARLAAASQDEVDVPS